VPVSRIGNSVTALTERDIRQSQETIASDLLEQTPGITVARDGVVGQPTSVFIRPADAGNVVVDYIGPSSSPTASTNYEYETLGRSAYIGARSTL
jgi:vitamin B12 transporter